MTKILAVHYQEGNENRSLVASNDRFIEEIQVPGQGAYVPWYQMKMRDGKSIKVNGAFVTSIIEKEIH